MNEAFITLTIPVKKSIALIAHDSKKHELIEWCRANKDILAKHDLCGTGTDRAHDHRPDRLKCQRLQQRPAGR